jgi:hypothetical protein
VRPTPITKGNTGKRIQPRPEQNRQKQQQRDRKRRLRRLVKNNVALDLKRCAAEVWLVGPAAGDLDKNNLALSQLLIFQPVAEMPVSRAAS